MSKQNRVTLRFNEETGRYHIENASHNPIYSIGYSDWVYEDQTMMKIIDQALSCSEEFPDAEIIWQMLVDGDLE